MHENFWHKKWENNDISFHQEDVNPILKTYINALSLDSNSRRILVPLCGKTHDIGWLLKQGYQVVGVELSESAVKQLFIELGLEAKISPINNFKHFSAPNIDIYVGNIFHLSRETLIDVDAIYDRAALVALPLEMRKLYAEHLQQITCQAPQLIVSYEYDQSLMAGPPFSVTSLEIRQHYEQAYELTLLSSTDVTGSLRLKGKTLENIWLLN